MSRIISYHLNYRFWYHQASRSRSRRFKRMENMNLVFHRMCNPSRSPWQSPSAWRMKRYYKKKDQDTLCFAMGKVLWRPNILCYIYPKNILVIQVLQIHEKTSNRYVGIEGNGEETCPLLRSHFLIRLSFYKDQQNIAGIYNGIYLE